MTKAAKPSSSDARLERALDSIDRALASNDRLVDLVRDLTSKLMVSAGQYDYRPAPPQVAQPEAVEERPLTDDDFVDTPISQLTEPMGETASGQSG